ncbi:hypothetical protein PanWU01x14_087700 [Parasponia andersonii]|uniref:Uncharacterized protein n=1 Tax=Parasponia andersonii TaxID=3476 RepID=A0A2P5D8L6_PARAD|nr:hypothetical protein PanWU01x14_087700 [Parasponia andersonii]
MIPLAFVVPTIFGSVTLWLRWDIVDHPAGLLDVKLSEFKKSLQRRVLGVDAGSYFNSFSSQQMVTTMWRKSLPDY